MGRPRYRCWMVAAAIALASASGGRAAENVRRVAGAESSMAQRTTGGASLQN